MGILAMIWVFIVFIFVAVCAHDTWDFYNDVRQQRVDRSKLIADTVLLCGIHSVCNQSAIPFPVLPETEQQRNSCAPCFCDVDCWSCGDCCVDSPYLYLTSSCESTQLIFNGSNVNISSKFNFEMITSCPETNLYREMKEQCDAFRNERSFLDNEIQEPVTSVITHVTYRNKYCARCHGDNDVISWDRFAKCETPFDTNIISTINELKNALSEHNCFLLYEFPSSVQPIPLRRCIYNYWDHVISTCNETGLWMDYDPSIEWACEHFQPAHIFLKDFRNIFCYICNPSIATVHHDVIVDRCKLTGEWELYDKGLEDGCLNLPSIQRLRPFKNLYCMLCNGRNPFSNTLQGHLGNLSLIISSNLSGSIAHIQFSETSLFDLLGNEETYWERSIVEFDIGVEAAKSDFINGDHTKNIFIKNESLFVSYNALKELQLICGENSVCLNSDQDGYASNASSSKASMNSNFHNSPCRLCNCNKNCFYDKTCCVDLLLNDNPYDCISNEIFPSARDQDTSSHIEMLAISTCKDINQPSFIRDMCHQQFYSNLISLLPGRSNGSVVFKNIFCSYCHDFKDNFQPLDIEITCTVQLEPTMFLSFSSLLRTALQRKCNVRVVDGGDEGCMKETLMVSKCNSTGEWHDYDETVQNMYELDNQFSVCGLSPIEYQNRLYKNIFCFMCNPKISTQSVIGHCNVTGNWNVDDPVLEKECQDAPEDIEWFPYKNWFCRRCNEELNSNETVRPEMFESAAQSIGNIFSPTNRDLFSVKVSPSADLRKEEVTCSNGMYDSYKMACTNVYCPVGRELKNESCMVLLEETKNLRYLITFELVSNSNHTTYDGRLKILLQNISSTIKDMMRHLEENLEIEYKTWSYQPCEGIQMPKNAMISMKIPSIFFQAKLRIPFTRNRSALELALMDFRKTTFQLEYNGANFMFERTQFPMIVPNDSDRSTLCRHDYTANRSDFEENENTSEYRHVSDLLACVMVQVSKNDYVYNNQTETINLINTSTNLQRQDFEFQTDESIRVCRDHLNQEILTHSINKFTAFSYQTSLMSSIHGIFSFVCTVISIICLVITFVTYCLFKTLRSLPGKNNMCLVLCLLCAQTLLQFGLWQSHHPIMCQVLAIGIHFFWMATFSSMNVCCFHMYRVFSANALAILTEGDSKKFLMWHIAYICAVPFSLIVAATTINYSLSDGKNTGYGGERCFLNNQYSIIFAFIIPAVVIFISNAVFFTIVFQKLRSSPIIESNSGDKRNFFMYVKLSTITGIAWPLQVIDGMLELSVFSFFVTFVNALQGTFIFASYICNRRVWKLYMECCYRRMKPKESWTRVVS